MESIIVTEDQLAEALAEWDRQYQANPHEFVSRDEMEALAPEAFGQALAPYLMGLLKEKGAVSQEGTA